MAELITRLNQVSEFPLCWPPAKPRAAERQRSPFRTAMPKAQREIEEEMRLWRANRYVVSMAPQYRQGRVDPGVAVWWTMPTKDPVGDLRVLACDSYQERADNLHAIALTLTGLRAFERYGTYTREQAIEGARAALPPPARTPGDAPPWWEVIGVGRDWPLGAIEAVWRSKLEKAHPDRGGSPDEAGRLNAAMDAARAERQPKSLNRNR